MVVSGRDADRMMVVHRVADAYQRAVAELGAAGIIATVVLRLFAGSGLERLQIRHLLRRYEIAANDLERIEVPTFSGRGSRSVERHRHAAAIVAETVPGAELIEFEGAAHGAHLTHPDAFARMVRSVVAGAS